FGDGSGDGTDRLRRLPSVDMSHGECVCARRNRSSGKVISAELGGTSCVSVGGDGVSAEGYDTPAEYDTTGTREDSPS
ncbi:hypothetical protein KVP02_12870, partial [Halobacterium salinarum]|uniref:hypothetical protein n=1 Tax=Halobacterium salinarum TaxID=2242 RepID=UPI001F1A6632